MAELPETAAAKNFVIAIARFPSIAATTAVFASCATELSYKKTVAESKFPKVQTLPSRITAKINEEQVSDVCGRLREGGAIGYTEPRLSNGSLDPSEETYGRQIGAIAQSFLIR